MSDIDGEDRFTLSIATGESESSKPSKLPKKSVEVSYGLQVTTYESLLHNCFWVMAINLIRVKSRLSLTGQKVIEHAGR